MTLQIGIANSAGVVTQNSVPMNGKRIDLADREHFRVHLDPERDAMFISQTGHRPHHRPMLGAIHPQAAGSRRPVRRRWGQFGEL